MSVLEVSGLSVSYSRGLGGRADIAAAKDVGFSVARGRTLGLIGESGSGKSTVLNAIAGLIKKESGTILWDGQDISKLSGRGRRSFRRECAMLFQSAAVDPKMKVLDIVAEPLRNFERPSRHDETTRVNELLELVKLSSALAQRFPGELSGGQLQRVGIARALALRPSLLLADEPVTALDASIRGQILDTLRELCDELQIACVFVTHDLDVARRMCDNFCIMRGGRVVERGDRLQIFDSPKNLYTKLLIASVLPADLRQSEHARERRERIWSQVRQEEALCRV